MVLLFTQTQRMVRRADVKVCTYTSASRSCLAWSSSTSDPSTQGLLSDIRGIFDKGQEPQPEKGGDADLKEEEHEEYYPTKGRPVVRRDIHKLDQIPPDMVSSRQCDVYARVFLDTDYTCNRILLQGGSLLVYSFFFPGDLVELMLP